MAAESVTESLTGYETVVTSTVMEYYQGMLTVTAPNIATLAAESAARTAAAAQVAKYTAEKAQHDSNIAFHAAEITRYRKATADIALEAVTDGDISVASYLFLAAASASRESEISVDKLRLIAREAEMLGAVGNKPQTIVYRSGSTVKAYVTAGDALAVRPDGTVAITAMRPGHGLMEVIIDPRNFVESNGDGSYRPRHDLSVGEGAIGDMVTAYILSCTRDGRVVESAASMINELSNAGVDLNALNVPDRLLIMIIDDLYTRMADTGLLEIDATMRAIYNIDDRPVAEVAGDLEQAIVRGLADEIIDGDRPNRTVLRAKVTALLQSVGGQPPAPGAVETKVNDILDSATRLASWSNVPKG